MSNPVEALEAAFRARIDDLAFGMETVVRGLVTALLVRGHVLLEGVPGIGKTLIARSFTRALGGNFERVQCTADLMPSDMTGVHVLNTSTRGFELRAGPLFGDVVLVDEINRAGPKTQSAMLQAMEERAITLDRESYALSPDFLVIATQNPHEFEGTYPLPESQLDRFLMRLEMGYPAPAAERAVLETYDRPLSAYTERLEAIEPIDPAALDAARDSVAAVHVDEAIYDYATRLASSTRSHGQVSLGLSTRGLLAWMRTARVMAILDGREFVTPDDIKMIAGPVAAHRLVLTPDAQLEGVQDRDILNEVLATTSVPRG